ncbi:MAG: HAMP domain-containing sensor histidine kinase [Alphaproteobacteria bacterium]|nr:HAMP domain-containing sensor histidine kinase [Alphaproteobacteria bacterium]
MQKTSKQIVYPIMLVTALCAFLGAFIVYTFFYITYKETTHALLNTTLRYVEYDVSLRNISNEKISNTQTNSNIEAREYLGKTGEVYFVAENGELLTESRFNVPVGTYIHTKQTNACIMNKDPIKNMYRDYRSVFVIGSYTKTVYKKNSICIIAEIDFLEIVTPFLKIVIIIFVSFSGLCFFIFISMISRLRIILSPLYYIRSFAERVTKGEYDIEYRPPSMPKNEIGDLSIDVGRMIGRFQEIDTKKDIISTTSHELRTPLTVTKGYIDLIEKDSATTLSIESKKYLAETKKQINTLLISITNILNIRKTETRNIPVYPTRTSIQQAIADSYTSIQILATSKHQELFLDIPHPHTMISIDTNILKRILLNVLSNAHKYTQQYGRIVLSADYAHGILSIVIHDNGTGIPLEKQKNLFSQFKNSSDTVTLESAGTGLNITQRLVTLLGGTITIASEEKKGTRVTITLPA